MACLEIEYLKDHLRCRGIDYIRTKLDLTNYLGVKKETPLYIISRLIGYGEIDRRNLGDNIRTPGVFFLHIESLGPILFHSKFALEEHIGISLNNGRDNLYRRILDKYFYLFNSKM